MMISVANPIYDSVFKYLMEDERIAKTILSALLKKEIESVELRPHEYANQTKDRLSMFRIDFGAKIREADGKSHLILIELQKTWLETETLRFRQYLGAQYSNKLNINKDDKKGFAIPMVSIYLLGHRVGDIDVPVLYVNHHYYDYDGNEVTHGVPDPFVESLNHNSIIVQIPLLHGQINNRLDEVLSIFDQSKADDADRQLLHINEENYHGDENMEYIVHRLSAAAADAEMRQDMNVEDEYFSALENRDTMLLKKDEELSRKDAQLKAKDTQLETKNAQLKAKDTQLETKNAQLKAKDTQLETKDAQLKAKDTQLETKNAQLKAKDDLLEAKDAQIQAMVFNLAKRGMNVSEIASIIGRSVEDVVKMLS